MAKQNSDIYKGTQVCFKFWKMMVNLPNLDLFTLNVYTNFGQILSIWSQDIDRKEILPYIKGSYSEKFAINDGLQYQPRPYQY